MLARTSADGTTANLGSLAPVVVADKPRLDLSQGMLKETGRPLDLGISGLPASASGGA